MGIRVFSIKFLFQSKLVQVLPTDTVAKNVSKFSFTKQLREYNNETSLHGPKYITEDGNHHIERYLQSIKCLIIIKNWLFYVTTRVTELHFQNLLVSNSILRFNVWLIHGFYVDIQSHYLSRYL